MSLLILNPGAFFHIESIEAPRYRDYFDHVARPEDLETLDLTQFEVLLVPCRTPANRMIPHREKLLAYLDQGGTIMATGESDSHLWLPNLSFTPQPTNFWWWLEEGGDLGVRVVKPEHPLFGFISQKDCTYHLHGSFDVPEGAETLVVNEENRPIFYIDEVSTKGRMIITSLDPFYHHGSHFMAATTRLLDGILPWLRQSYVTR